MSQLTWQQRQEILSAIPPTRGLPRLEVVGMTREQWIELYPDYLKDFFTQYYPYIASHLTMSKSDYMHGLDQFPDPYNPIWQPDEVESQLEQTEAMLVRLQQDQCQYANRLYKVLLLTSSSIRLKFIMYQDEVDSPELVGELKTFVNNMEGANNTITSIILPWFRYWSSTAHDRTFSSWITEPVADAAYNYNQNGNGFTVPQANFENDQMLVMYTILATYIKLCEWDTRSGFKLIDDFGSERTINNLQSQARMLEEKVIQNKAAQQRQQVPRVPPSLAQQRQWYHGPKISERKKERRSLKEGAVPNELVEVNRVAYPDQDEANEYLDQLEWEMHNDEDFDEDTIMERLREEQERANNTNPPLTTLDWSADAPVDYSTADDAPVDYFTANAAGVRRTANAAPKRATNNNKEQYAPPKLIQEVNNAIQQNNRDYNFWYNHIMFLAAWAAVFDAVPNRGPYLENQFVAIENAIESSQQYLTQENMPIALNPRLWDVEFENNELYFEPSVPRPVQPFLQEIAAFARLHGLVISGARQPRHKPGRRPRVEIDDGMPDPPMPNLSDDDNAGVETQKHRQTGRRTWELGPEEEFQLSYDSNGNNPQVRAVNRHALDEWEYNQRQQIEQERIERVNRLDPNEEGQVERFHNPAWNQRQQQQQPQELDSETDVDYEEEEETKGAEEKEREVIDVDAESSDEDQNPYDEWDKVADEYTKEIQNKRKK